MKRKIVASVIIIICILLAFGATVIIEWLYDTFGHLTMDEIIFHIKVPMKGANTDIVNQCIEECLLKVVVPTLLLSLALIYPMVKDLKIIHSINTSERKRTIFTSITVSVLILTFSMNNIVKSTDILTYIESQTNDSQLIANEYVNPKETNIEFSEQKRNLIYIFLESMETTYYSVEDGGLSEDDLIPEISKLAKENINFSETDKIGGAHVLTGAGWTVGAMAAQTTGVPLKLSIDANALSDYSVFLGGAYSIGQVLEDNGYNNFLLLGSDAGFGGRKNLFEQHGNYEIWDASSAIAEKKIDEWIGWGYSDDKLFEFAKDKILELSKKDEPFNFTTLTVDTHFPDGTLCEDCENKWDEQYKNVISCSSKKVGEFVEWVKEQEFYDNTTIVIAGDHLTMQSNFFELEEGQEYDKKVVNLIINPAVQAEKTNRSYSTMDLYPTTLAAMGAKIEGNKLGLGTNLFSSEETLIEKYGLKYVNDELMKVSKFYNNQILVSK